MSVGVVFPPGIDEPVPSIGELSKSEPPGPFDPQPTQSIDPDVGAPEPQVSRQPAPWEIAPELPQSRMPPSLKVDLTGVSDEAPPIGPLPAAPNPFDFWP